ncbi:MAG TPA: hypothetical protein VES42_08870 [Pilimelia sp.]|nr:hypothetical protein [Pilimelia sp.]
MRLVVRREIVRGGVVVGPLAVEVIVVGAEVPGGPGRAAAPTVAAEDGHRQDGAEQTQRAVVHGQRQRYRLAEDPPVRRQCVVDREGVGEHPPVHGHEQQPGDEWAGRGHPQRADQAEHDGGRQQVARRCDQLAGVEEVALLPPAHGHRRATLAQSHEDPGQGGRNQPRDQAP